MTDERSWTTPRHGRPNARPWHERLPVYPRLVRHGRAGPAARDTRHRDDIRRDCNFRPRDIRRDDAPGRLQRRKPRDAPSWRAPLPACRPLGRRGPAGPTGRDSVRLAPRMPDDKAHMRATLAPTIKGTIR